MASLFVLVTSHLLSVANAAFIGGTAAPSHRLRASKAQNSGSTSFVPAAISFHSSQPPPALAGDVFGEAAQLAFRVSENRKSSPEEVDELEKVVSELVKKGRKDDKDASKGKATPMDPSVAYIADIIDTTMLPNREREHRYDQERLDRDNQRIRDCEANRNTLLVHAESAKDSYDDASSRHKNCRLGESGEWMEQDNYCRPEAAEVKRLQSQMICAEVEKAQRCKYIDYTAITDAEAACDKSKAAIETHQAQCDQAKSRYTATKVKCDHWQSMMDEAACKHTVRMKEACSDGDRCYQEKLATFQSTQREVEDAEMSRSAEIRALMRMKCLLANFKDGKVTDREVDTCKQKTHDPPMIIYPTVPNNVACKVPDTYPGTAAYKDKEFKNLPPQANGKPSAGQCYAMAS